MLDLLAAAAKTKERVTKPRYIYVTDQGDVFSSTDEPTREDLRFAKVGMLTIVRLADLQHRGKAAGWQPIGVSELTRVVMPDERSGSRHTLTHDS